jgi:hypothetical protein
VTVSITGANRDPAVFADPDVFDVTPRQRRAPPGLCARPAFLPGRASGPAGGAGRRRDPAGHAPPAAAGSRLPERTARPGLPQAPRPAGAVGYRLTAAGSNSGELARFSQCRHVCARGADGENVFIRAEHDEAPSMYEMEGACLAASHPARQSPGSTRHTRRPPVPETRVTCRFPGTSRVPGSPPDGSRFQR